MVRGVEQGGPAMDESSSSSSPSPVSAPAGQAAMTAGGIATVAAVLIVFAALTLAFVLLQCYCDERRRAVTTTSTSGRGRRPRPRRRSGSGGDGGTGGGVDPEVLRSLPVTVYSRSTAAAAAAKEEEDDDDGVECAVCLAELEDGEEARFLPRCGHGFHAECVDMWLGSHSTCPLCRLTVVVPPPPPPPLPPVQPEPPASYTVSLPASVLLGLSDHGAGAVTMTAEGRSTLVIEIPESAASTTPRDAAARSSPSLARLRSLRRLWSFGRQGAAGSTSSCSCATGGDNDDGDVEHGVSVTVAIRAVEAATPARPPEAEAGARTAAAHVRN
ncbi:E3 ubiquitin-protein ligase EL5 [Oryza glaberrima]|uniref:RING-type E3 ubiquitin transferase n=1 Tax=Oryza glaberrima TaxID=4538 RepID=I1P1C6_ORYGL|nr:E3 ubiquitin-protein ligase EL5 [Oryza glaberrima]